MEKEDISAIDYKESSSPHPTETQDLPTPRAIKGLSDGQVRWLSEVSPKEADRIYHKVDKRLVPMLALLYLIAHLDRVSSGRESHVSCFFLQAKRAITLIFIVCRQTSATRKSSKLPWYTYVMYVYKAANTLLK